MTHHCCSFSPETQVTWVGVGCRSSRGRLLHVRVEVVQLRVSGTTLTNLLQAKLGHLRTREFFWQNVLRCGMRELQQIANAHLLGSDSIERTRYVRGTIIIVIGEGHEA